MTVKEKMTAPIASVGADVEQPLSNKLTNQSIADLPGKGNLQATNNSAYRGADLCDFLSHTAPGHLMI